MSIKIIDGTNKLFAMHRYLYHDSNYIYLYDNIGFNKNFIISS